MLSNKDRIMSEQLPNAQKYFSLTNFPMEQYNFAENSSFYAEVMDDGHIYNPYIHRRWLPYNYRLLWHMNKDHNQRVMSLQYSFTYSYILSVLTKEIDSLYTLYTYDRAAYMERSQFFTLDILKECLTEVVKRCKPAYHPRAYGKRFVKGLGWIPAEEFENLWDDLLDQISMAKTIKHLWNINRRRHSIHWDLCATLSHSLYRNCGWRLPQCFYEAYDKAGAYYTIKHYVMFEHSTYRHCVSEEGLKLLRADLDNGNFNRDTMDHYVAEALKY